MNTTTTTTTTFRKNAIYGAAEVNAVWPGLIPAGCSVRYVGVVRGHKAFVRIGGNDTYFA